MKRFIVPLLLIIPMIINSMENYQKGSEAQAIRIMSYNIRREGKEETPERSWTNRFPLVQKLINTIQPDIIGFQEPTKEQVQDLQTKYPALDSFGEPRGTSWWGLGDSEYNPIFYDKHKFKLLASGTFSINTLNNWLGWLPWHAKTTGWLPRICTWGKFQVNGTNQQFYVYNTHFDHMFKQAQITCAQSVMRDIKQRAHNLPVIVMGDFNTGFTNEVKRIFEPFAHAKNCAHESFGPQETSTGWTSETLKWIDHILVRRKQGIDVAKFGVVATQDNSYPSDHRPIFADVILQSSAQQKK